MVSGSGGEAQFYVAAVPGGAALQFAVASAAGTGDRLSTTTSRKRELVMSHKRRLGWAAAAMVATILAGTTAIAGDAKPRHKWRIVFSEGANSDGTIRFAVTPVGGDTMTVEVPIKDGRSENHVAQDVRDGFKQALPADQYHVEVDDGEDVLVKSKGSDAAKFTVSLVDSSVKSVRIHVEHD
jgi:hypothetical protein